MRMAGPTDYHEWLNGVRGAFHLAAEGMPVRAIARKLNENGFTQFSGKPYSHMTLYRHLTDPGYAGLKTTWRTSWIEDLPVISPELFQRVLDQFAAKKWGGRR